MIITTFGTPSAFTQWCTHLLGIMAEIALDGVDHISGTTVESLKEAWRQRSQPHVLFFSDHPDQEIVDIYQRTNAPVLIFVEDLVDAAYFIARERQIDFLSAVHLTVQSILSFYIAFFIPRALIIQRNDKRTMGEFFHSIGDHIGWDMTPHQFKQLEQIVGVASDDNFEAAMLSFMSLARSIGMGHEGMPEPADQILIDVLNQYQPITRKLPIDEIVWPWEVLRTIEPHSADTSNWINLVGPGRCITYGPYFGVPRGHWTASVVFSVKDNKSGNIFYVDVVCGEVIAMVEATLPENGSFLVTLDFQVDTNKAVLEIRTSIKHGAIEGEIAVDEILLVRSKNYTHIPQYSTIDD